MVERATVCLRRLACSEAEEVRFQRWLGNFKVTLEALRYGVQQRIGAKIRGGHVLAIQDTTEVNYQAHAGKVRGLGPVGNGTDLGLFVHPVLAVDAAGGHCLGLADVQVWTRSAGSAAWDQLPAKEKAREKAKARRKRALEDKESQRWVSGAQAAEQALWRASCVTTVQDREGDLYPLLARPRPANAHFLVRSAHDWALVDGGCLIESIERWPVAGSYELDIAAQPARLLIAKTRPGRSARTALMAVRHGIVRLRRPIHMSSKDSPAEIALTLVDVRETAPPAGEAPVHWRLLTSHPVFTLKQAQTIIGWYRQRWHIEQLFRTLKLQGLDLESSQIETDSSLMKLAVVATQAATTIMQLVLARDGTQPHPASDAFSPEEIQVMEALQPKLNGRTAKQQNPHPPHSMAWAAWTMARLGGWKGYASKTPPGPITMRHGLKRFVIYCDAFALLGRDPNRQPYKQDLSVE